MDGVKLPPEGPRDHRPDGSLACFHHGGCPLGPGGELTSIQQLLYLVAIVDIALVATVVGASGTVAGVGVAIWQGWFVVRSERHRRQPNEHSIDPAGGAQRLENGIPPVAGPRAIPPAAHGPALLNRPGAKTAPLGPKLPSPL